MRQIVMISPGKFEYRDVPCPSNIKDHQILVKIERIGICGSDIHVFHGQHPATPYPVIQGHEYSATVVDIGAAVTKVRKGMKVTARPQITCSVCAPCRAGRYNVCQNLKVQGFQADGVAQDYFVINEHNLVVIPENIDLNSGAMIEPLAVAAHSTNRASEIKNKNVVVSGAGTIGNLVAQFAKIRGASKVMIADYSSYRLGIAKQVDICETVNLNDESFEDGVKRVFGDDGYQVGFEAAGVESSLTNLISNVEKGGEIVILGVYSKNPVVNMFHVGEHELNLKGTMMYLQEDYQEAVKFLDEGKVITEPLITKVFSFEQYLEAYKFIESNGDRCMKVIIDMSK